VHYFTNPSSTKTPRHTPKRHAARLIARATFALLAASVVAVRRADAYIDPGSGALLWQGLLAAVFGLMFYAKGFVRLIKSKLHIGVEKKNPATDAQHADRS
jgi:hypothetical protein